jgi:hypothetical protein
MSNFSVPMNIARITACVVYLDKAETLFREPDKFLSDISSNHGVVIMHCCA